MLPTSTCAIVRWGNDSCISCAVVRTPSKQPSAELRFPFAELSHWPRSCPAHEGAMSQPPSPESTAGQSPAGPVSSTEWGKAPPVPEITQFLQGPQKRGFELRRAIGIFFEIMRGFRKLHFLAPCVTVFGSARFTEEHEYY